MGRSSSKRKTQTSPTFSADDSDYVPDEELDYEENEEENEEEYEENEEDNEEENEEDEEGLDFDPHRFIGKDAQDSFDSYWSKQAVLCERGINLNQFNRDPLNFQTIMATRGWTTAMAFRATADPNLIREFFANAMLVDSRKSEEVYVTSMVRGKQITVRRRTIRAILSIPKVSKPGFPYPTEQEPPIQVLARHLSEGETRSWGPRRQFPKNKLSGNFRILHELICSQILPVANDDYVSPDRARLMYALTTGVSVDLASLIMTALRVRLQQTKSPHSLLFAGLLMQILENHSVTVNSQFRTVRPLAMLSRTTSARSLGQSQHRSTGATSSTAPLVRPPVVPTVRSAIHALGARLGVIEAEQRAQRSLLEQILAAVSPPLPPPPPVPDHDDPPAED